MQMENYKYVYSEVTNEMFPDNFFLFSQHF